MLARAIVMSMVLMGGGAGAAVACAWHPPADLGSGYQHDLVLEGNVVGFERLDYESAVLSIEVTDALRGEAAGVVSFDIVSLGMGAVPDYIVENTKRVIVAAVDPARLTGDLAERYGERPMVVIPICGTAFVVPATDENRAEIELGLAGHEVLMHPIP